MIFQRTDPNAHYRSLRLMSGAWELGFSLYASGMRLRMGRQGRPPSVLDFCLGQDEETFLPILAAVMKRLEPLPETAEVSEIDAAFPWKGTRPDLAVHLDPLLTFS